MFYLTLLPCCFCSWQYAIRSTKMKSKLCMYTYFTRSGNRASVSFSDAETLEARQPSRPLLRVVTTSLGKVASSNISSGLANCPTCSNLGGFRWIW